MRRSPFTRFVAVTLALSVLTTAPGSGVSSVVAQVVRSAPISGRSFVPVVGQMVRPASSLGLSPAVLSQTAPALTVPTVPSLILPSPARAAAASAAAAVPAPTAAVPAPSAAASVHSAPAAKAAAAMEAPALNSPAAAAAEAPVAALSQAAAPLSAAAKSLRTEPKASFLSLGRLFDGGASRAAGDAVLGLPSALRGSGLNAAKAASRPAEGAVPSPEASAQAAKPKPYAFSLALAGLGAGAAYLLIPVVVPMLSGLLPFALPAIALKAALVTGGFALGASLLETDLWRAFPGAVASGALDAGRTAFRFWARFGLVFRSVLSASSIDEAMKAELPARFWKYPLLAWPFVLVGYVFTPFVTAFGAVFKAVEIPVRAAWRGMKRIVVGLLPFMADVFAFIGKAIRRFIPAVGAFFFRGGRMAVITAVGGALVLAAPIWNSLVKGPYAIDGVWDGKLSQVPAALAMVLGRALGFVAALFLGALGGIVGFVFGLPLTVTDAVLGFAAKVAPEGAAARADARWTRAFEDAHRLETMHLVTAAATRQDGSTLPRALARLVVGAPGAVYALPFSISGLFGLWAVSLLAAFGYEREAAPESAVSIRDAAMPTDKAPGQEIAGSPWIPLTLAWAGAIAGGLYAPVLLALLPLTWIPAAVMSPWLLMGSGALAGAALGLALSQPKAWTGGVSRAYLQAKASAADAFRLWARLGLAARVSVTGRPVDGPLFDEDPAALTRYPLLAWPAVVAGYFASAAGFVVGGTAALLGVPLNAAWRGLVILLTSGLIRRILRAVKNVLVHGIPFVFGFAVGTIVEGVRNAFGAAAALALPVWRSVIVEERENPYRYTGLTGLVLKRIVQFVGAVAGLAAGLTGFVIGAVVFSPHALTSGLRKGLKWADAQGRVPNWLWRWEKNLQSDMTDASGKRLAAVVAPGVSAESGLWQGVLRAFNGAAYALSSVLWALPVAVALYYRAARNASVAEKPVLDEWTAPASQDVARARPDGFSATVAREAGDAWSGTLGFWKDAGAAFSYAVARDGASVLGAPYAAAGAVLGAFAFLSGALAGAVEVPGRAFLQAAKDLALKFLPFLEKVWNLALRIAKRVFPFLGGAFAGAFVGALGSAAFGAVLLGRPWFKYVAGESYDTDSVGRFLGVAALRLVAALAGVVFGVLGLAFGLLAALPYSLTFMAATAFDWGGIGGSSERFFRNWRDGALLNEMRRLSKLTDSFDFSDKKGGADLNPVDGWVRLGMVTAATFAASLAATVAGWVAYGRSVRDAYRATKEGRTPPSWDGPGGRIIGDTADRGSKVGRKTGRWLGTLGGLAAAGAIAFGYLTAPSWLGALGAGMGLLGLVVLSGPVGWLAGLLLGALVGTLVGMLRWLERLMRPGPAEPKSS
ncbi:MAG: hypothetical protein HY928_08970 [Elusimicrobia bacterium]|nr:hypothetical protein [Elusimicrobiota bacterium]